MPIIKVSKDTDLPTRREYDFYPTPYPFAMVGVNNLPHDFWWTREVEAVRVLEPGAGAGVWGQALRDTHYNQSYHVHLTGSELRETPKPEWYDEWVVGDYLEQSWTEGGYDLIMANPPYNIAFPILEKSLPLLCHGGMIVLFLRLQFLASARRTKFYKSYPPTRVVICGNRPSFTGDGKTNADDFAFYYWRKGYSGVTDLSWVLVPKGFTKKEMLELQEKSR